MSTSRVRLELLVRRKVRDPEGRTAGRIEEVRAEWTGSTCRVVEYELGTAALLDRLGISAARLIGLPVGRRPLIVPWEQMDLSIPDAPRLRCRVDELRRAGQPRRRS